ncbi:MAG TPA: hypothetical protein DCS42_15565 [Nitrospiraceae bacterium]|nr:hypothetical protein [Nitrospiraceae bacterium]
MLLGKAVGAGPDASLGEQNISHSQLLSKLLPTGDISRRTLHRRSDQSWSEGQARAVAKKHATSMRKKSLVIFEAFAAF